MMGTICEQKKRERTGGKSSAAEDEHFFAVETVSDVTGDKEEEDAGEKLREADETEVERALGDFVDLPADGYGLHLGGENDAESRDLVEDKGGIRKDDAPVGWRLRIGHRIIDCHRMGNRTRAADPRNFEAQSEIAEWMG